MLKKDRSKQNNRRSLRVQAKKRLANLEGGVDKLSSGDIHRLVHELSVHQIELEMQNEELRQMKRELESRLVYINLFDFAPAGYFTMRQDGTILQVNVTGERLLNKIQPHIVGARFGMFVSETDRPIFNAFLNQVFSSQVIQSCEITLQQENKETLWVFLEGIAAEDRQECRVTASNINMLKQAQEEIIRLNLDLDKCVNERTAELENANNLLREKFAELELTQETLHSLFTEYQIVSENAYDWEYWLDEDEHFIYTSPSCKRITGYERQDFMRDSSLLQRIIYPDDLPKWQEHRKEELSRKFGIQIEFRIQAGDGSVRWMGHICQPVYDDQGVFIGTRGSNRDISERKQVEEKLWVSETYYRSLFENMLNGYAYCRILYENGIPRDFIYLDVNHKFEELTGLHNIKGKRVSEVIPGLHESNPGIFDIYSRVALTGKAEVFELYIEALKDWYSISVYSPEKEYFIAVFDIITERKMAEKNILTQAERAEALVHTAAHLNAQLDLPMLLQTICQEAASVLHAPAAWINLDEPELEALFFMGDYGMPPEFKECYPSLQWALYDEYVTRLGPIAVIADVQKATDIPNRALFTMLDIRTIASASMLQNGQLIGILNIVSYHEEKHFNEDELSILKGLTDQAALAIINSRLFKQVSAARQQLSDLTQALIELQETERRKMALELHDELGQLLSSAKLSLAMISTLAKAEADEQLERVQTMLGEMIDRVRRMALELRPSMLDDNGLLPALLWLFKTYRIQSGEKVAFKHTGMNRRFSPQLEITSYRIIQEALTNVMRHAGNKQVYVNTWADDKSLNLEIRDFGVGFDPVKTLNKGITTGLSGMRERVRMQGGEMAIESALGKGTSLTIRLPLESFIDTSRFRRIGDKRI
jgi:PAS domain S-box-containing protein